MTSAEARLGDGLQRNWRRQAAPCAAAGAVEPRQQRERYEKPPSTRVAYAFFWYVPCA